MAETKNARGSRGNSNGHITYNKGNGKGKGKAAKQHQGSAEEDANNAREVFGKQLHATMTASAREGRERGRGWE